MNYSKYFAIEKDMKANGIEVSRTEWISKFTNGRKKSLKELTDFEYKEVTEAMAVFLRTQKAVNALSRSAVAAKEAGSAIARLSAIAEDAETDLKQQLKQNQMRRKIIALFCKMGYVENGVARVDRINAWCVKYGQFHKPMNDHSYEETVKLVAQVEEVYKSFLETL